MYLLILLFASIYVNGETSSLRRSFIQQEEARDDTRHRGGQESKDNHRFHRSLQEEEEEEEEETVHCRYVRGDIHYIDGGTEDFDACEDGNTLFDLPPEFLDGVDRRHDLHSGRTRLDIKGAHKRSTRLTNETDHIEATGTTHPRVILRDSSIRALSTKTSNEIITSTGTKSLIIVRVTSRDSTVTLSSAELSESTFGNGVSLATQVHRCSNGKLQFVPATGTNIQGGVGELYLDEATINIAPKNLQTALREAFVEHFGSEDNFDLIAFCLPKGTGSPDRGWIAYAYRDTKFSYYNDEWGGSLTSRMHEIGHCMGVGHSGEGDLDYEDRSCVMGVSFVSKDGPQECYNGWRHFALDWYADRELGVDPVHSGESWGGKLAAFVDYEDMKDDHYAIVNVRDVYLQYNLADKHNWEVGERADEITIVRAKGDAEEPSSLLGGIRMDSPTFEYEHDGDVLVFEVCNAGKDDKVRFLKISIHERGMTSACNIEPKPTPVPLTPSPTPLPTDEPTVVSLPPSPKRIKARQHESSEEDSGTCVDSTLSFKVNTIDVTCENIAKDSTLKALYCNKGNIAYLECSKTCHSCGFIESSGSTGLTSSTLRRTPLRPWNLNDDGNSI